MRISRMTVTGLAGVVTVAAMLVAGCATSVQGAPAADPAAVSALAAAVSTTTSHTTTPDATTTVPDTPHSPTDSSPSTSASTAPITPMPPVTTDRSPTTTADATPATVQGIPVDEVATKLRHDPVVVDRAARDAANPEALADLDIQVTAARKHGLDIWVVLIGHKLDKLTDVSDAIARRIGGTVVIVSASRFAASSKHVTNKQLSAIEDVAASGSSPVQVASIMVENLVALAVDTKTGTTEGTDSSPASFQLADHSIGCMIVSGTVRCDLVVKHSYTPPTNPHPNCQGDYGSSILMTAHGAPAFVCVSDSAFDPHAPVLHDGGNVLDGHVMCFADGTEVSCVNLDSVHGFALSPGFYDVF